MTPTTKEEQLQDSEKSPAWLVFEQIHLNMDSGGVMAAG